MKKSQLLELLQNVKAGKVKIDAAITEAETSRRSLVWDKATPRENNAKQFCANGFLYKVLNGEMVKIPEKREGKIFQPYYRSINPKHKAVSK